MKSPLVLPLYLALVFLAFLLVFTTISMTGAWVGRAGDAPRDALRSVFESAAASAETCLSAALFPAVFLTGLRVARCPVSRPFSLLLPAATAFCLLAFGPVGLRALGPSTSLSAAPPAAAGVIRPGVLTQATGLAGRPEIVLAASVSSDSLEDLVVLSPSPPDARLGYHAAGRVTADEKGVLVRLGEGASLAELRLPESSEWAQMVEPSSPTSGLLGDLAFLARALAQAAASSELDAALLSLGVAAFLCFSTFILRAGKWPLLAFVLQGLLWRAALVAIRFGGEAIQPALADLLPPSDLGAFLSRNVVSGSLIAAALLCLLIDLAFVSFDFREREIET